MSTALRIMAVALVVATGLVACGQEASRPTPREWVSIWESQRDSVPNATAVMAGGRERCDAILGSLRDGRDTLLPTPAVPLDTVVRTWLGAAEGLMLECPTDDPDDLGERLDDLEVIEAGIDAGLAAELDS